MSLVQEIRARIDIASGLAVIPYHRMLAQGDKNANRMTAELYNGDDPVDIAAANAKVGGTFVRKDGSKVPLEGEISGNEASVLFNDHCYAVDGEFKATLHLLSGETKRTVMAIAGRVAKSGDGPTIDVEDVVPDLDEIIAVYEDMQTATTQAQQATQEATEAAAQAQQAAKEAEEATASAEEATTQAQQAVGRVGEALDTVSKAIVFANLINPEELTVGYSVSRTSGATYASENYSATGLIPVTPGDRLILTRNESRSMSTFGQSAFYGSDQKKIGYTCAQNQIVLIVPDDAVYFRTTLLNTWVKPSVEVLTPIGFSEEYLEYGTTKTVMVPAADVNMRMFLPDTIYSVPGKNYEIYFNAVFGRRRMQYEVRSPIIPNSSICTISSSDEKLRVSPVSNAFITRLDVHAPDGSIVRSAPVCLRTVSATTESKRICCIGDSLTNAKPWQAQIQKYNPNFTFVGTFSTTVKDIDGEEHTIGHDGRGGWTAEEYCATADNNSFWDGSAFSFSHYVENTLGGTAPDCVIMFLGQNSVNLDIGEAVACEKQMIDSIRDAYPEMRIIVCAPQYRAFRTDNATAANTFAMQEALYGAFKLYSNLIFVPLGLFHDSENNYSLADQDEPVNPYSGITQHAITDSVHPQNAGYWQFADAIFAALSALTW